MEKRLKEQVDAMFAFVKFCNENETVWFQLTGFANGVAALSNKVSVIINTASVQEKNTKGVTLDKNKKKIALANETVAVSQALQAYSVGAKNFVLSGKMSMTFTKIKQAMDSSAIGMSESVYDTASGLPIADLEPFGITENVLQLLKNTIENFVSASPTTRISKVVKTALTVKLTTLVKEGNMIMRKQLLKLGRQFKKNNPEFYMGLVTNAKVIRHSVHSKIRLNCIDELTKEPLAGAEVFIEGTDLKGSTNKDGKITISKVPDGQRDVVLRKPNYIEITLKGINFQRGHSITRRVEIPPAFDVPVINESITEPQE